MLYFSSIIAITHALHASISSRDRSFRTRNPDLGTRCPPSNSRPSTLIMAFTTSHLFEAGLSFTFEAMCAPDTHTTESLQSTIPLRRGRWHALVAQWLHVQDRGCCTAEMHLRCPPKIGLEIRRSIIRCGRNGATHMIVIGAPGRRPEQGTMLFFVSTTLGAEIPTDRYKKMIFPF